MAELLFGGTVYCADCEENQGPPNPCCDSVECSCDGNNDN